MSINSTADNVEATAKHKSAMNRMYRVQRHIYDATRAYFLLGRDKLIDDLKPAAGATVLEVGCGTGRNIVKAAMKYKSAKFYGFDISDEMLSTACQSVMRQSLQSRVQLAQGDATDFDPHNVFRQLAFDRIYISFTLSMIPNWQKTIATALNMLKSDGELIIVDFGQCENLPRLFRIGLFSWLQAFGVQPQKALHDAVHTAAIQRGFATEFISLYGGYAWLLKVKPTLHFV